ncbi:hypothetical protein RI367_008333 [Sorochytrium milnesiophthora]
MTAQEEAVDKQRQALPRSNSDLDEAVKLEDYGTVDKHAAAPQCHHSCVQHAASRTVKSFAFAFAVKYLLGTLPAILRGAALKRPALLLKLLSKDTLRFALFVGSFSGLYNSVQCALRRWTTSLPKSWISFCAGSVAGLSMAIDNGSPDRRTKVCLYFLVKTAQFVCRRLLELRRPQSDEAAREVAPTTTDKLIHFLTNQAGTMLMAASASQILHSFLTQPETLSKSYRKFLMVHTGVYDRFGAAANTQMRKIQDAILNPTVACTDIACTLLHPGAESCLQSSLPSFVNALGRSAKMYATLNMATLVLLQSQKLQTNPLRTLLRLATSTVRSSVFLSLYPLVFWLSMCYQNAGTRKLSISRLTLALPGLTALIENRHRRLELGLYCMQQALESAWNSLIAKGVIPTARAGQVLPLRLVSTVLTQPAVGQPVCFALTMGTLMMLYESKSPAVSSSMRKAVKAVVG